MRPKLSSWVHLHFCSRILTFCFENIFTFSISFILPNNLARKALVSDKRKASDVLSVIQARSTDK